MNIFADSGGWAAYFNDRDEYHDQALAALESVAEQAATFVITDYILDEALTLVRARAGHAKAVLCGQWLIKSPRVRRINVTEGIWQAAWELFQQYDDKDFSFTDCTSFVVMRQQKLRDVFTFDHHFEQMGFRLWPGTP